VTFAESVIYVTGHLSSPLRIVGVDGGSDDGGVHAGPRLGNNSYDCQPQ